MATPAIDDEQFEQVAQALERRLGDQVTDGTPELVLVGLLRGYADMVEKHGYVPRSWETESRHHRYSGVPIQDLPSLAFPGGESTPRCSADDHVRVLTQRA